MYYKFNSRSLIKSCSYCSTPPHHRGESDIHTSSVSEHPQFDSADPSKIPVPRLQIDCKTYCSFPHSFNPFYPSNATSIFQNNIPNPRFPHGDYCIKFLYPSCQSSSTKILQFWRILLFLPQGTHIRSLASIHRARCSRRRVLQDVGYVGVNFWRWFLSFLADSGLNANAKW
jgi:hypothetical protein